MHALLCRCLGDKTQQQAATYCAEGLFDRMFYNSITGSKKDLEIEVMEIYGIGVRQVLLVAFEPADQMPPERVIGT